MSDVAANRLGRWLAVAAVVVVIATVSATIVVTGTPAELRRMRVDARRVADLDNITKAARNHAKTHGLPQDLATLAREPGARLAVDDPEGRGPYEYTRIDAQRFRLCATFTTDTAQFPPEGWPAEQEQWKHGAGRQCFVRTLKDDAAAAVVDQAAIVP